MLPRRKTMPSGTDRKQHVTQTDQQESSHIDELGFIQKTNNNQAEDRVVYYEDREFEDAKSEAALSYASSLGDLLKEDIEDQIHRV